MAPRCLQVLCGPSQHTLLSILVRCVRYICRYSSNNRKIGLGTFLSFMTMNANFVRGWKDMTSVRCGRLWSCLVSCFAEVLYSLVFLVCCTDNIIVWFLWLTEAPGSGWTRGAYAQMYISICQWFHTPCQRWPLEIGWPPDKRQNLCLFQALLF